MQAIILTMRSGLASGWASMQLTLVLLSLQNIWWFQACLESYDSWFCAAKLLEAIATNNCSPSRHKARNSTMLWTQCLVIVANRSPSVCVKQTQLFYNCIAEPPPQTLFSYFADVSEMAGSLWAVILGTQLTRRQNVVISSYVCEDRTYYDLGAVVL